MAWLTPEFKRVSSFMAPRLGWLQSIRIARGFALPNAIRVSNGFAAARICKIMLLLSDPSNEANDRANW
jgi:hypothetical protein